MALDLPTLIQKVRVDADTKGAEDQTKSAMSRIGGTMTKVGIGLTAGVTVPIVGLAAASISAASDLAESSSKVGVVFEDNADKVRDFASTAATSLGISEQAALEATGTFGNLFRALGVGTGPAAEMSTSLVELAADLASFNNANPEDVLLALRSGLLGEAEPLRQFGVSLSAARIESEALASGLVKPVASATKVTEAALKVEAANRKAADAMREHGKGSLEYQTAAIAVTKAEEAYAAAAKGTVPELTAAQKATAAYAIIQQDTALAQGDFERTSDGLANQQRILAAQFQDVKASLGEVLLPVMQKAAGFVIRLLDGFKGLTPEMRKTVLIVAGVAAALGPLLIIGGQLAKSFTAIRAVITGSGFLGMGPLLPIVVAVAAAGYLIYRNWDTLKPIFEAVAGAVRQLFSIFTSGDFSSGPLSEDSPIISGAFAIRDVVIDVVIPAFQGFVAFMQRNLPPILTVVQNVLGAVGRFLISTVIPALVSFAQQAGVVIGNVVRFFQEIAPQVQEALGHVMRVVNAVLGFIREVIGVGLDIIAALWRAWGDDIFQIVSAIFNVIREVVNGAVDVIANIIRFGLAIINGEWGKAWDAILGILRGVWDAIFGVLRGAVEIVRALVGGIVSVIGEVLRPLGNFLFTWVIAPFEAVVDFIRGLPGRITNIARGMFNGIRDAFKSAINFIIRIWNGLDFEVPGFSAFGVEIGGFTLGLPHIDELALGGRSTPGHPFLAGEHGPELVSAEAGSAQVLNADRTERLLRSIAGGAGLAATTGPTYPIHVETIDRPSGERLGRDIAWGIAGSTGRPLAGTGAR